MRYQHEDNFTKVCANYVKIQIENSGPSYKCGLSFFEVLSMVTLLLITPVTFSIF